MGQLKIRFSEQIDTPQDLKKGKSSEFNPRNDMEESTDNNQRAGEDRGVYLFRKPNFQLSHFLA